MGWEIVFAMVVASMLTHGWETSTRRASAAWQQAQQRAQDKRAERDKAQQARVKSRKQRVTTARKAGPRDPLWWPWAAGWVLAGAIRATAAGVAGAREGAKVGATEGRRFGHEAAARGWKMRRAWQEYRRRRAASQQERREQAGREGLVMEPCEACGVYVTKLVTDRRMGRVCEPCAAWRAGEQPPTRRSPREYLRDKWQQIRTRRHGAERDEPAHNAGSDRRDSRAEQPEQYPCDGLCTNSDIDPEQARAQGLCGTCGGRRELVWNFGPEHGHFPCAECDSDLPRFTRPRVDGSTPDDEPDDLTAGAARVEQETNGSGGTAVMTAPAPTNGHSSNGLATTGDVGTGEGYASTVATLQTLARQLAAANETAQHLAEQLSADELDADTLTRINELMDQLDAGAPLADATAKHVEQRHGPVADAVAEAGGSPNVARKGWYDEH